MSSYHGKENMREKSVVKLKRYQGKYDAGTFYAFKWESDMVKKGHREIGWIIEQMKRRLLSNTLWSVAIFYDNRVPFPHKELRRYICNDAGEAEQIAPKKFNNQLYKK